MAMAMPRMRGQDAGSRKKKIPTTAMMAAPPARIIGTAERLGRRKRTVVRIQSAIVLAKTK